MRSVRHHSLLVLVVFALLAQLLAACGSNQRQKALATAFAGVNGARDGFVQWDEKHQSAVVLTAKTYEDGLTALADYREQRDLVVTAFELAYQALAAAALDPNDTTFEVAMGRVEGLYSTLKVLMGDDDAPAKQPPD